jgi:multiple antibiotic resistance protein
MNLTNLVKVTQGRMARLFGGRRGFLVTWGLLMVLPPILPLPAIAIALSLAATWIILKYAAVIQRLLGDCVTEIMAKVLGLLVAAIAIKIIADGIIGLL